MTPPPDAHALAGAAGVDDAGLMLRIQADDADAFGVLYDRLSVRAYGVAYGVARDRERAEDIVQSAFLSVWQGRARYKPFQGTVDAWVMGTVRDEAIDSVRRRDERDQELRGALSALPEAQRDVIALAYFGELSAADIAQELSLPLGTVKGRMRLGLDKLQDEG